MYTTIPELINKYITNIKVYQGDGEDHIDFHLSDGSIYRQKHDQDCCESVTIEDVDGNIEDLIGQVLIVAEESSSDDPNASESGTWTYYKFATKNGYVSIRWYGCSNGYYSESVNIERIKEPCVKEERKNKLEKLKDDVE